MTDRPRRARPAAASRVLASGLSAAATLGIVGGLAAGDRTVAAVDDPPPASPSPAEPPLVRVVVRVHHPAQATAPRQAPPAYVVPAPRPPVRRVYVHRAQPPQPPVTTSHGSR